GARPGAGLAPSLHLIRLAAELHRGARAEGPAQDGDERRIGAARLEAADRGRVDVPGVFVEALLHQVLLQDLELFLGDLAELGVALGIEDLDHRSPPSESSPTRVFLRPASVRK